MDYRVFLTWMMCPGSYHRGSWVALSVRVPFNARCPAIIAKAYIMVETRRNLANNN